MEAVLYKLEGNMQLSFFGEVDSEKNIVLFSLSLYRPPYSLKKKGFKHSSATIDVAKPFAKPNFCQRPLTTIQHFMLKRDSIATSK